MTSHKFFGALIAAIAAFAILPLRAEPVADGQRRWSQPDYHQTPDMPLSTAPELDSFPGTPTDDDAALLDGDGRPLTQDGTRPRR